MYGQTIKLSKYSFQWYVRYLWTLLKRYLWATHNILISSSISGKIISCNSHLSHEEKIAQMLSSYATSPLEKMDKSISFFWKNMAQGDKYEKAFSEVAKKWLTPPPSIVWM